MSNNEKRSIVFVLGAIVCFWFNLYLYVPILPLHAQNLGADLNFVGLIVASYAIGQILFRIPIGIGSDVLGSRKLFACISTMFGTLGSLGLAISTNETSMLISRTLVGIGAAGWVAISILYASYFGDGDKSKAMSYLMFIHSFAVLIATLIGGYIAEHLGNISTFWASTVVGIIGTTLLLFTQEKKRTENLNFSLTEISKIFSSKFLIKISLIGILPQFVTFSILFGFLPVFLQTIGANKSEIGLITSISLFSSLIGILITPYITKKIGLTYSIWLSGITIGIGAFVVPFVSSLILITITQVISGLGRGMINTILISAIVNNSKKHEQATSMGFFQAIYALGMFLGPALSGNVANIFGINFVFYFSGLLMLITPLITGLKEISKENK